MKTFKITVIEETKVTRKKVYTIAADSKLQAFEIFWDRESDEGMSPVSTVLSEDPLDLVSVTCE